MEPDQTQEIRTLLNEIKKKKGNFLGFPCNQDLKYSAISQIFNYSLNNIGDPFVESVYELGSRRLERKVIHFFADIYGLPKNDRWGYVTNGGTEGNMYGIFLGRELYPDGILYFSEDTHYSIAKIARVLNISSIVVSSQPNGEMDYAELERNILKHKNKPPIICANYGTTMKGAIDDFDKIIGILKKNNVKKYYIHVDAALFGMILPFIKNAPHLTFKKHIDSMAISGHKFIGTPFPCGVVLTKKQYVKQIESAVEYIGTIDTTIPGSRNGHSPLLLWHAINSRGKKGFSKEAKKCLVNAGYLHEKLQQMNYPSYLNPNSNIVWFKKPPQAVMKRWQLAPQRDFAHIVVMQHASKKKLDAFLKDLKLSQKVMSKKQN